MLESRPYKFGRTLSALGLKANDVRVVGRTFHLPDEKAVSALLGTGITGKDIKGFQETGDRKTKPMSRKKAVSIALNCLTPEETANIKFTAET